ncbi:hypothetical protein ASG49_01725 [Marmoricola sp. Leaf446]|uniref:DUF4350 domain-containing protein n=1 Tax=Marmoricola sp. Leaf446 TaxID=1736379 RepID=UPI0006F63FFF|nr:DUF4350 domain-containing protein [Marmoricola sp. Leaf446]KQT93727.1 hypothetical protein ASG49_01725 [Marmoricola sp. Leaf446]
MTYAAATAALAPDGLDRPRRSRTPWLLGALVLLVLVVVTVLGRDGAATGTPLDPDNPGPDGARALARVLEREGVEVAVVRGQEALLERRVGEQDTVVVTAPEDLVPTTQRRLERHAARAAALVYAGEADAVAERLDLDTAPLRDGTRPARCADPLAGDLALRVRGGLGLEAPGCFGVDGTVALTRDGTTWGLAGGSVLANEHVTRAGAAALGLRLLGQGDRVVWYVPDLADAPVDEGSALGALLPPALLPSLLLLGAATVALVLWRGRRFGPLATEPLPVVVRAAESTHSRGRLYRRAGDRAHAATALVTATRRRLHARLRLPTDAPLEALVAAVAARTGRRTDEVTALLRPPSPTDDTQLVDLGQRLHDLEDEVHRA